MFPCPVGGWWIRRRPVSEAAAVDLGLGVFASANRARPTVLCCVKRLFAVVDAHGCSILFILKRAFATATDDFDRLFCHGSHVLFLSGNEEGRPQALACGGG